MTDKPRFDINNIKAISSEVKQELPFDEQQRRLHEEAHSDLLKGYTKYQLKALKQKARYKKYFFWMCMVLLVTPLVFGGCALCAIENAETRAQYNFAIIACQLIAFVSAVAVLPKTIAEYCFNKYEDGTILKLFLNAQRHDKAKAK